MLYIFHTQPRLKQQVMLRPLKYEVACELLWAVTLLVEYGPAPFGLPSISDMDTSGSLCALWVSVVRGWRERKRGGEARCFCYRNGAY